MTKPLLYNYFGNKEGLYAACMERAGDALSATIAAAVAATGSPEEALRAGGQAFFAFLDAERAAWAVLFDETLPRAGEIAERVAAYRGQILDLVTASIMGQVPPSMRKAPPRSRSRRSPRRCSAPPRHSPTGGCAPRRSPPRRPPTC